jgi:hypothetical protein
MLISVDRLMISPEFFPITIDYERESACFVRMSRAGYYSSSFLDSRAATEDAKRYTCKLGPLLRYSRISVPLPATHYILHSALCCSTLLTRYLDLVPNSFVLREPHVLRELAALRLANSSSHTGAHQDFSRRFDLVMTLLTRTYDARNVVIIKAHDLCSILARELLDWNSGARIVFVSIDLRSFILSVLRSDWRRQWLRGRLKMTRNIAATFTSLAPIDTTGLCDARASAFLWLLNRGIYSRIVCGNGQDRIKYIDGGSVANSPERALRAVLDWFNMPLADGQYETIFANDSVTKHAKNQTRPFDSAFRAIELEELGRRYEREVDDATTWAVHVQQELQNPM